ncbi:hypothetical protein AAG906_032883 [Vitis piasezkii]
MRLETIQRDFLSGGGNLGKKPYLVSWTTICTDKKGGLGIRSLSLLNRALLESGVGDMFLKGKSCGSKLKRGNMGRKEQASTLCEVGGGYGVGVWKATRKGWNLFFSKTSFGVRSLGGGFVGRLRRGRTLVPHFTRNVNDWELEVVENFFSTLQVKTIRREVNDKVIWKDGEKDCFVSNAAFEEERSVLFPKNII